MNCDLVELVYPLVDPPFIHLSCRLYLLKPEKVLASTKYSFQDAENIVRVELSFKHKSEIVKVNLI